MTDPSAPDIYLMKRRKSRAGCLSLLVVLALVAAVAAAVFVIRSAALRRGTDNAGEVDFPSGAPEAPLDTPDALPDSAPSPDPAPVDPAPVPPSPAPDGQPSAGLPPPPPPADQPAQPAAPTPPPPPPPPPSDASAAESLAAAKTSLDAGDFQAARLSALAALDAAPGDPAVEAFLSDLAIPLLASPRPMPEKTPYTVRSGDMLSKIAGRFNTPVELIRRANNLSGDMIRVGQSLLLFDGKSHTFAVTVSKSRNDLLVTLDGKFFKRYRVATGVGGKTPAGSFKIVDKIEHPTWHPENRPPVPYGSPENLLGTHWLALDCPGIGIHGTWQPETVGSQSSDGCIRMLNDDVAELYSILPRGTAVSVVE